MTGREAFNALADGKKVRARLWDPGRYCNLVDGVLIREDGTPIQPWSSTTMLLEGHNVNDWELYEEPPQLVDFHQAIDHIMTGGGARFRYEDGSYGFVYRLGKCGVVRALHEDPRKPALTLTAQFMQHRWELI